MKWPFGGVPKPVAGEPIELFGGPLDGIVARAKGPGHVPPPIGHFGEHHYHLEYDGSGFRYVYQGQS